MTITPSENTHFRVILSSEAMEEESRGGRGTTDPVCSIVKPEPRTIKPDECSCKAQPPAASSHGANNTEPKPDLSSLISSSFTPEPCPSNADLSAKNASKARWTSSSPSRQDSSSTASAGSNQTGDSAAVCPDQSANSKATDSPIKRRGNTFTLI